MEFASLPTTPTAEELLDKAFSRAARAGRAKSGVDAQASMLQTASNILSDNLENVVRAWPDFDSINPFYYDLADAIIADLDGQEQANSDGVGTLRRCLAEVSWASRKTKELGRTYQRRIAGADPGTARKFRKQAFARMADVVEEIETELDFIGAARDQLRRVPDIRPDEPTIVVAGYPNVGKSSFVNAVTNARVETAEYPFTTTGIHVGHAERDRIRYQLVDTPGLLDRPMAERNEIERQAVSALANAADTVVFLVDASESCGYPLSAQLHLRDEIASRFPVPVVTICNKADLSTAVDADHYMSVTADDAVAGRKSVDAGVTVESVDGVLTSVIKVTGYEPEFPFEDR